MSMIYVGERFKTDGTFGYSVTRLRLELAGAARVAILRCLRAPVALRLRRIPAISSWGQIRFGT